MKTIFQSLRALIFFTLLTGLAYPLMMTGVGQILFSKQANGSLINKEGTVVGSALISQKFTKPEYFWPRPSASDFSANPSGASNLGPTSQDLKKQINDRREALSKSLDMDASKIPQDLLTTSGSGVDPHISPQGAKVQIMRIVKARQWSNMQMVSLNKLIDSLTEGPTLGILGDARVNVLKLNLALDGQNIGVK